MTQWTVASISALYHRDLLSLMFEAAHVHQQHFKPGEIQVNHLVSVKTGGCPEDCHYCPQSARYNTGLKKHALMSREEVRERAVQAKAMGASRVCLGAAWREVKDNEQFDRVLEMVRDIKSLGMETCCTLGLLTEPQAQRLKEAGLHAYNHNLDTSPSHYSKIISTRQFEDRLRTLSHVKNADLQVCCGGILGLGETEEDRIRFLLALTQLEAPPESIPINTLYAVEGTPLADQEPISIWELLRMIATTRLVFPTAMIRMSAGREKRTLEEQTLCFLAGANSIFIGEKLLTIGNPLPEEDHRMFAQLGLTPKAPFASCGSHATAPH